MGVEAHARLRLKAQGARAEAGCPCYSSEDALSETTTKPHTITLRSILAGAFFSAFFAFVAIAGMNTPSPVYISSTQIAPLCYVLLLGLVLLLNPFLRLIRIIRPFSIPEVLVVFVMGAVSSGIPIYGLAMQLLPVSGSLFYKDWNSDQAEWNRYVEPFVDEHYFLSEPGIQAAAKEYRAVIDRYDELNRTKSLAGAVVARMEDVKTAEALPEAERGPAAARAQRFLDEARKSWDEYAAAHSGLPGPEEVQRTYPAMLTESKKLVDARKAELNELSALAAAKVELFRRGLPKTMQAYPGIIPVAGDDAQSYWGRLRRLTTGWSALRSLKELDAKLAAAPAAPVDGPPAPDLVQSGEPLVETAIARLEPISDSREIAEGQTTLNKELERLRSEIERMDQELTRLNASKRTTPASEQSALAAQIADLISRKSRTQAERDDTTLRRNSKDTQLEITQRIQAAVAELKAFREKLHSGGTTGAAARLELTRIIDEFPSFDVSLRRYFFGDTPWGDWWPVLWRWGLLALLTYVILITFNVLIFRQWAHNEKLIYPLAELPMILGGKSDSKHGGVPEIFKSGLFWIGFLLAAGILGWNFLARSQLISSIAPLDLNNKWEPYIKGTWLRALLPSTRSQIFFTVIGLSFFTPAKTSFSLWFFRVVYMIQLFIMVNCGYGDNEDSFPSNWWYTLNFSTAEGEGAMIVFSAVALYTCRKYLLCAFIPRAVSTLELDEQRELRASSFLFLGCSLCLILMLWQGMGANIWFTLIVYGGIMLLTIGLVRAVAEGGIMGFQAFAGPFHFIRSFVGFDRSFSSPALFTPLMVYYSVFFLDIKSYIAPMIANSLKIRDDLRMERGRFHFSIGLAIVLAAIVSIGMSLMMAYTPGRGANGLEGWFFTGLVKDDFYPLLKSINQTPPQASSAMSFWIVAGAAAMAALLYYRQSFFWLPHPIGMIMLINPLMRFYWFPILLGWLAKALVTRYGSRDTYTKLRAFFIGLIVGELMVVSASLFISYWWNLPNAAIDLDRSVGSD